MLKTNPEWTFKATRNLTQWYGHVHLLSEHVVGQWFATKRANGHCLWETTFSRPNHIFEIVGDVILASEMRSDGAWTADFGCYAISLSSGQLIWQWHGTGIRGWLSKQLEPVTSLTNEFRPSFLGVKGSECLVTPNRVLDLNSGKLLGETSAIESFKKESRTETQAKRLYNKKPVYLTPGLELSCALEVKTTDSVREAQLILSQCDKDKVKTWQWGPHLLGLKAVSNFYGWRMHGNILLFLGSEDHAHKPDPRYPTKANYVVPNATRYHLILLDAISGTIIQQFRLSDDKVKKCRIEDVDSMGVLISHDDLYLSYYSFNQPLEPTNELCESGG